MRFPRSRAARAASILLALTVLSSCSKRGGGQLAITLHPGESVKTVLDVHAGQAEGGTLTSCDLATLNQPDADTLKALEQIDATVGKPAKSATRHCSVEVDLTAHPDAAPGEYRLEVLFFYAFSAPFQVDQEGSDFGSIFVTVQ